MKSLKEKRIDISSLFRCDEYCNKFKRCRLKKMQFSCQLFGYKESDVVLAVGELLKDVCSVCYVKLYDGCKRTMRVCPIKAMIRKKFGCEKPIKEKMCQIRNCNKCNHKEGDGFKCRYDNYIVGSQETKEDKEG